jgi:hypothetical protein
MNDFRGIVIFNCSIKLEKRYFRVNINNVFRILERDNLDCRLRRSGWFVILRWILRLRQILRLTVRLCLDANELGLKSEPMQLYCSSRPLISIMATLEILIAGFEKH